MKKWLISFFTILATVFLLVGCSNNPTSEQQNDMEATQDNEAVIISISEDHESEIITEKVIEIGDGDILMDVMKEHFAIEEEGGFINSIDEVAPAEGEEKAWMFFVNGEMAMVGAAEYELSTGDYIVFDLQAWE